MKNKTIISKREDGFTVSLAQLHDFSHLIELIDDLSEETKSLYNPWMFRTNTQLKIKFGQLIVRLSLVPMFRKLIKKIIPKGYAVILNCESPDGELAGSMCMYNFKKLPDGKYMATENKVVFDKFQNIGLSNFITKSFIEIAKKENVRYIRSGTRSDNIRNKKVYTKFGWKHKETIKDGHKYKDKLYDQEILILELKD